MVSRRPEKAGDNNQQKRPVIKPGGNFVGQERVSVTRANLPDG